MKLMHGVGRLLAHSNWQGGILIAAVLGAFAVSPIFQGGAGDGGILLTVQLLLLCSLAWQIILGFNRGLILPRSFLALAITLYWVWLAVSLAWSRVPFFSAYFFWWVGTLPLCFWLFTLTAHAERAWRVMAVAVLGVSLVMAFTGMYQFHVLGEMPKVMFLNINSYAGLLALIAVPAAGYFLVLYGTGKQLKPALYLLGLTLWILIYAIGLTKGRGPLVSFLIGMVLLMGLTRRQVPGKAQLVLVLLVVSGLALANLAWTGAMVDRLASLGEPVGALRGRYQIWLASWELLKESPLWGIGLGVYALAWPPYRNPVDGSAGYFVHNDYLQIWIESGLPGLILFLSILVSAGSMAWRLYRRSSATPGQKIETIGLSGGLAAVSIHSLVDFDFYAISILILVGACLARLQQLSWQQGLQNYWKVTPARWLTGTGYRVIVILLFAFPVLYFVTLGLSVYKANRGMELALEAQIEEAELSLIAAERFNPFADSTLVDRAELYQQVMRQLPPEHADKRKELYAHAVSLLDQAAQLNPLRVMNPLVRARLYQENPDLVGPDWMARTAQAYEHALAINPRSFEARYMYARFLLAIGDSVQSRRVLEGGLRYSHMPHAMLLPYYAFTAELRMQQGDPHSAEEMRRQIEEVVSAMKPPSPLPDAVGGAGTP